MTTHQPRSLPAPSWRDPFVLIVVGQINAGNRGRPRARAGSGTYAISVDGLIRLEDPLPGASGSGGSPWPYWASLRQASHPHAQIIVGAIAQSSSAVADWTAGGTHAQRLPQLLVGLRQQGLQPDAVLWHQGETEAWSNTDPATYAANLRSWLASVRALGINAPIYVSLTSRDRQGVINPGIRLAQASVWSRQENVFAGPDTDSLDSDFRSDGVHFNQSGLEAFACLLEQAMTLRSDRRAPRFDDSQPCNS